MKSRPILFSGPMVRALRDNQKTQTRRTRGLDKINAEPDAWELLYSGGIDNAWWTFARRDNPEVVEKIRCPYGVPGDQLWTRETWKPVRWDEGEPWVFEYADGIRMEENDSSQEAINWIIESAFIRISGRSLAAIRWMYKYSPWGRSSPLACLRCS